MQKVKDSIIIREDDYQILASFLRDGRYKKHGDTKNMTDLEAELKKAKLVNKKNFPGDVIRLNSKIKIKDVNENNIIELTLVTPDKADIKQKKISVMAPVGTALIGFKQGQKIKWQVPAGKKTFYIVEVVNDQA